MTAYIDRFPHPGETIIGNELLTLPGGKGGNQAVALARLGAHTTMFGKIGDDKLGEQYQNILIQENVNISQLGVEKNISSGIALIEVEQQSAQNRIIVIPGANGKVDEEYIQQAISYIVKEANKLPQEMHIVLFQLEIPLASVAYALELISQHEHIISILDPAPVPPHIPEKLFSHVDYITPNETEALHLTGIQVNNEDDARRAGIILLEKGCKYVIIKAGEHGAYFISKNEFYFIPQIRGIKAVDTTAAGDSFNAGFAYSLGTRMSIQEAILFANKVAGLSTTKAGAQVAMPTLEQVKKLG